MESPRFEPRAVMEMAIKAMQHSVAESRDDDKASPKVGAVLVKPGPHAYDTAYRGELRDGDHAEFTLLERKNRDQRLDGSVLFVTLEPCAPGARNAPKLSCAERIVLARIKEVWVGIEDPDPKVDRKGIKYLQDRGVTVQMFDRDLQEVIREANKDFIAQAVERALAAAEEEKAREVTLSRFAGAVMAGAMDDFSRDALEQYRKAAKIDAAVDSSDFRRRLLWQGLLMEAEDGVLPTGFGMLLFGREPRAILPHAGLLGTIHFPDGTEEHRDFDGPLILIPGQLERWLADKLPNTTDRSRMHRQELPTVPFEPIREGVVNALVHRDYEIAGAKCQIVVSEDTITVSSPGRPPTPVTVEQLQSFSAPMLSRNPELHYVFARMDLAEERGLGMKTMRAVAEKYRLPLPSYRFDDPYLKLTIYRSSASVTRTLPANILEAMSADEQAAWQFVATKDSVTTRELRRHFGFDERKAQRVILKLLQAGLLIRVGSGRSTRYESARSKA